MRVRLSAREKVSDTEREKEQTPNPEPNAAQSYLTSLLN